MDFPFLPFTFRANNAVGIRAETVDILYAQGRCRAKRLVRNIFLGESYFSYPRYVNKLKNGTVL